ncbi:MAG: response regulator, partial [Saprospiraceae bacterium]
MPTPLPPKDIHRGITCLAFAFLFVFSFITTLNGQPNYWKVQRLSTESGLSNRFVNCITQDNRGFTWIGTNFGLNRYDGHRVDILTKEANKLQTNTIHQLHVDVNHNIWVVHREVFLSPIAGIDILDPISFKVKTFEETFSQSLPFRATDIKWALHDSLFNIYILTLKNDVYRFDKNGFNRLFHIEYHDVQQIGIDGGLLIYYSKEADMFEVHDLSGKKLNRFKGMVPDDYTGYPDHGWYWLGSSGPGSQLFVLMDVTYTSHYYATLSKDGISNIKNITQKGYNRIIGNFDPFQKKIWGFQDSIVFILDPATGHFIFPDRNKNFIATSLYTDKMERAWIGSEDGILIFSKRETYFEAYLVSDAPFYSARSFAEARDGDIHILTHGRNVIFDPVTKTIRDWTKALKFIGMPSITDINGDIWFSGENYSLCRYTPHNQELIEYRLIIDGYFVVWSLLQAKSGSILLGTTRGLWIHELSGDQAATPFTKLNGFDILNKSTIYHMRESDEGIWLSTDNGLFLVDLIEGVKLQLDEASGLPNSSLLFLHKDTDEIYWLASRGGGLIRWDRTDNAFKSFTVNEGLSHNIIYAIFEDKSGFLWMPSDLGLMRFEKSTGICRTFLPPDGIPHEEFNRTSYFVDSKGNFYFGGLNGFIVFNPDELKNVKTFNFPVRLTKLEAINETSGETKDLTYESALGQVIKLSPQVSSFVIHYSILDYDDPLLKRFAYRIDGLNENWTYVSENFMRINGLKGGEYQIRIKGQSSTGQWSENELVIPVVIMKPFFARWYTQFVLILILLGLFLIFYRRRSALHKAKLEREMAVSHQLRQVDKLKDQFLANTSHELRTPLNGIVGLSESLLEKIHTKEDKEDLELIISSGRRLSNLVNDILDFSRLKEHDLQLNLKPVDIRNIAELCLRMNRHLIHEKDVILQNDISEDIPCCLADENRLQQIMQNLVANAIKFTHQGLITIDAQEVSNMIVISVTDTGIGIAKEKQEAIFHEFEQADGSIAREFGGTGLGLSITKYLVELHGGNIGVVSEPGKGSIFSFTIPAALETEDNFLKTHSGESTAPRPPKGGVKDSPISTVLLQNKFSLNESQKQASSLNADGDNTSKRNILVVDDEPVNLKVLKNHLEREGYDVTLASDGQEALNLLENGHQFHLVLLDVMMPRIPGYEVCQRIRERYLMTELPVIMVTAKNQVSDLVEGLGIGANDYIVKPFSKDELLARVKSQLDNYEIHEATNRFVPHEFIHSLGRKSIIDLHRGDMVEQNVHVMFSDIRDYTALSEDMSPQENFKFVNTLAGKVGPIVKQNHGMINQYLGDTIMMLFLKHADDGVQAGIDILRSI